MTHDGETGKKQESERKCEQEKWRTLEGDDEAVCRGKWAAGEVREI